MGYIARAVIASRICPPVLHAFD